MDNNLTGMTPPADMAPVAPPAPEMPPVVYTQPQTPTMETGGKVSKNESFKEVFSDLNPMRIGYGILASAAFFFLIDYFRYNKLMKKTFVANVEDKIDELTIKYSDLNSALQNIKEKEKEKKEDKKPIDNFIK